MKFKSVRVVSSLAVLLFASNVYGQKLESEVLDTMKQNLRINKDYSFSGTGVVSLEQALKRSAQRSGELFIMQDEYKLAGLRKRNALKDMLPDLAISYEESEGSTIGEDFRSEGAKIELGYELYPYNRSFKKYAQAKLMKEAAKLKYDYNMIKVLSKTEKAYYVFAEAADRYNKINAMMSIFMEAKDKAKDMVSRNLARNVDSKEVQLMFTEARIKLNQAKNEYMMAELAMKQLWDYYENDALNIRVSDGYNLPELNFSELSKIALDSRPDIRLYKLTERISIYNRDISAMEDGAKMMLDSFWGSKGENYVSEELDKDGEYYVGVKFSMPFGSSTVETEYIDQDTVPSAGQTTSTQFTTKNIKLKLFDNRHDEKTLKANIAHYKSVEEGEELKKNIIFDVGRKITKVNEKYEMLSLAQKKIDLAQEKLDLNKIGLSGDEISLIQYMHTAMDLLVKQEEYSKALAAYYVAVTELNSTIGQPGYFNPVTGKGNNYFSETCNLKSALVLDDSKGKHRRFRNDNNIDSYKDLRFKKSHGSFMGFPKVEYRDKFNRNEIVK